MAEKSVSLKIGQQKIPKLKCKEDKENGTECIRTVRQFLYNVYIYIYYIYIQLKYLKENREKNNRNI